MNISNKTISIAFIVVLIVTVGVSVIGMSLMSRQPMVLQGAGRSHGDTHQRKTAGACRFFPRTRGGLGKSG